MSVAVVVFHLAQLVTAAGDQAPEDEDVKAGWTAFVLFLLLIGAVVVLAFSLVKQLRKAQAAKDAGLFGDEVTPADGTAGAEGSEPENHATP